MNNKYSKEEKEFINLFNKDNSVPTNEFEQFLSAEIQKKLLKKNPFFSNFFIRTAMPLFVSIFIVALVLIPVLTPLQSTKQITVLSNSKKEEILKKATEVNKNNFLQILDLSTFTSKDTLNINTNIEDPNANFKRTIITYVPKSDFKICVNDSNLNPNSNQSSNLVSQLPKEVSVIQIFDYKDKNISAQKITFNSNEIKNTLNKNLTSFAVSFPVSYITSNITFNSDFQIKQDLNTLTNFVIQEQTIENNCLSQVNTSYALSTPVSYISKSQKIIKEIILNKDFSIKEVNFYKDSINIQNLFAVMNIVVTEEFISNNEFNKLFN